jgi:hypothetical protein
LSKNAIRARRRPLGALLAAVASGALVLLVNGGIAMGSSSSAQYEYGHPVPATAPSVSGTTRVGEKLTTSNGTWTTASNVSRYSYAWGRCKADGNNCATIGGATSSTYTLVTADQGNTIRSYVTATNANGSTEQTSPQSAVVAAAAVNSGKQIAASAVQLPNRLVVDQVKYSANPIRARHAPTTMQVHVSDGNANSVQGALVFVEGLPYSRIDNIPELATNSTGWATVQLQPGKFFPRSGYVVLFVRARVSGQDALGGTSTRRLVQITVGTPNGS